MSFYFLERGIDEDEGDDAQTVGQNDHSLTSIIYLFDSLSS
jgi:hypothetical protein